MSEDTSSPADPFDLQEVEAREPVGEKVFTVNGNRLRFLQHPEARFEALIALIDSARESVRCFYFMVWDDEIGRAVLEALCRARGRGCHVSFGIDSFGSAETDDSFYDSLRECGVPVFRFSSRVSTRYLIRNHQKMTIVDDKTAMVGGFNLTHEYFGMAGEDSWADMGVLVEGDASRELAKYYDAFEAIANDGHAKLRQVRRLIKKWSARGDKLCWIMGGPSARLSPWARHLKLDLEKSDRLDVVEAYFSPGRGLLKRIGKLARRGEARLILASKSDNQTTIGASRLLYNYLIRHRVKVFEYLPTRLHMKLLVIDDVTYLGSANLDARSLFINMEDMLRIDDADVAAHMRAFIDEFEAKCEPQTAERHKKRLGPFTRFRWWMCYLAVGAIDYNVSRGLNLGGK